VVHVLEKKGNFNSSDVFPILRHCFGRYVDKNFRSQFSTLSFLTRSWQWSWQIWFCSNMYSTDWTQPNTRANPERTRGLLPWFALRSLLKILRSLWVRSAFALGPLCVRSGFATGSLLVRYLGVLYALMREADTAFILQPVSPAPCIFQTFT
jgi:hypothetical protein